MGKQAVEVGSRREWLVLAGLVVSGAAARWLLQDWPNFAPVSAIALFAGYFFRERRLAWLAPLGVMLGSDLFIGGYSLDWRSGLVLASVYVMMLVPVCYRGWLRRALPMEGRGAAGAAAAVGLTACSLACSLLFFAVTNLAVFGAGWYGYGWSGLVQCYVQAAPFFRFTLAGDLFFAGLLFGGYCLAVAPRRVNVETAQLPRC